MKKEKSLPLVLVGAILCLPLTYGQAAYDDGIPSCYSKRDGTVLPMTGFCTSYIYCENERPKILSCPTGKGFSATAGGCIQLLQSDCIENAAADASAAKETQLLGRNSRQRNQPCYAQPEGTILPVEGKCNHYYYCLSQIAIELPCPYGMGFSAAWRECVLYDKSDCAVYSNTVTPVQQFLIETTIRTCVDNEKRPENQAACYGQPFGELVPYPGNCAKFLVCNCEYPTVKDCAPGTWFDNKIKNCNFPQNVDCDGNAGGVTPSLTTPPDTQEPCTTAANEWGKNCEAPEGMSADICLKYENDILLRYPYNCNAYINCTMGCPVMTYCMPDKVFNDLLKICDTPDTAHCEALPIPTTTTTLQPTTTTTQKFTTSTQEPTTTTTQKLTTTTQEPTTTTTQKLTTTTQEPTTTTTQKLTTTTQEPTTTTTQKLTTTTHEPTTTQAPTTTTAQKLSTTTQEPTTTTTQKLTTTTQEPTTTTTQKLTTTTQEPTTTTTQKLTTTTQEPTTTTTQKLTTTTHEPTTTQEPTTTTTQKLTTTTQKLTTTTQEPTTTQESTTTTTQKHTTTQEPNTTTTQKLTTTTQEPATTTTQKLTTTTQKPTTESTTTQKPTTETSTTVTEESTTPFVCVPPADIAIDMCTNELPGTVLSYPYNCSAYVLCNWRCPYLEYCGHDEVFNAMLGICDNSGNVKCEELPYPTPGTPEPTTTTTELPTTTPLPPDVDPKLCVNEPDYTLYPYEANCKQYLVCVKGQVKVKTCPNGWFFNAELKMCDDAGEDVCFHQSTTTEMTTTGSTTTSKEPIYDLCIGQPEGVSFPYPENCQMYYYCTGDGKYNLLHCPYNNYYEPYSGNCGPDVSPTACKVPIITTTTEATTLSPQEKCKNQDVGQTFPYEANCRQYIMCTGKDGYTIVNCPANNFYYPDSGNCGPSADEDICRKGITTTTVTTTTTTTTTTSPVAPPNGICGDFVNGELISYPGNCQKYISCVRPIPIGFFCPNHWYFDASQQTCVPDFNGSCSKPPSNTTVAPPNNICLDQEIGGWQVYPNDCQLYYECLGDGHYMLQTCNEGEYFNPLTGKCTGDVGANYCKQDFDTTTTSSTTITTTPVPKPQGICWQKPNGTKVPYPDDCSKYIVCNSPIPVGYSCPLGLQFSSEAQTCVDSSVSDCGMMETSTTEPSTTTAKPVNQCTGKPNYALLPYKPDCSMFVICINDYGHLAYCNRDEYFDIQLGECSAEGNKDSCLAYNASTTPGFTTDSTTTTAPTTSTTTTTTITTEDPNLGPCYGKPEGTKLPYPNNCEKYVVCRSPIPVGYDCSDGLEFNADLQECMLPELANCSIKTTTSITTITTITPSSNTTPKDERVCNGLPNGTTLTYPDDCSKFYICLNGNPRLLNCTPNSYYNPSTGQCDSSSPTLCQETTTPETTTAMTSTTPSTGGGSGFCSQHNTGYTYPNSNDCSQYYMCLSGTSYLVKCPNDTYFDPNSGECNNWISSEACKGSNTTTTEADTTTSWTSTTVGDMTTNTTAITEEDTTVTSTITVNISTSTATTSITTSAATTPTTTTSTATTTTPTTTSPITTTPTTTTSTTTTSTTSTSPATSTTSTSPTTSTTSTSTTTPTRPTSTPTTPTTTSTTTTTIATPCEPGDICCGHKSGTRLPYPGDSTKYIICLYPLPEVAECPTGTIFDAAMEECNSNCYFVDIAQCLSMPYGSVLPYQGNCRKYYTCHGAKAKVKICDENWYFNASLSRCVPQMLYDCPW